DSQMSFIIFKIGPSGSYPFVQDLHLSPTYTGEHIAHSIIVAYGRMLVMGSIVPSLRRQKDSPFLKLAVPCYQGPATRSSNYFIPVKGEDGNISKCSTFFSIISTAQCFGTILKDRNTVTV